MRAVVRRPSKRVAEGEVTHLARVPVDVELARAQHDRYVALLRRHGAEIVEAPELDEHPDGLFVEDALVMIGSLGVLARPGAESRRGEVESIAALTASLGVETERITAPGTLDGGDVLVTDRHVFVGRSTRTNDAAIEQLRAVVQRHGLGREVVAVEVTGCLHLKSAITALPDGSLIAVPGWVPHEPFITRGYAVRDAADTSGGDLLCLGSTVVLPADAVATAAALRVAGFAVEQVDVGELQKIEAGVTCMSVLLP